MDIYEDLDKDKCKHTKEEDGIHRMDKGDRKEALGDAVFNLGYDKKNQILTRWKLGKHPKEEVVIAGMAKDLSCKEK